MAIASCTVYGDVASCKYEIETSLNTSAIIVYYAMNNDIMSRVTLRFAQASCVAYPDSIELTPLHYSRSTFPTYLKNGKSEYFIYGFTHYIPTSKTYIDSLKWNCIFPLVSMQSLTSGNNRCYYRSEQHTYEVMSTFIATKEEQEMVKPFEYEITNRGTTFSYVSTVNTESTIVQLPSLNNTLTQYICSKLDIVDLKPTCKDLSQNGHESDIDCGGVSCDACINGKICFSNTDCISNACVNNMCVDSYTTTIIILVALAVFLIIIIPVIFSIVYFARTKSVRTIHFSKRNLDKQVVPTSIPVYEAPDTAVGTHYHVDI